MPKSRSNDPRRQDSLYKGAEASARGLGPRQPGPTFEVGPLEFSTSRDDFTSSIDLSPPRHGASRDPATGLLLKEPSHPTVNKSVEADRQMGFRTVQVGRGLGSFDKSDPRVRAGSVAAPRDTDISGATFEAETRTAIEAGKAPRTAARRRERGK